MSDPLVDQLRFTRSEWLRGLEGLTASEATRHFGQMNCISWDIGHMVWQEQRYWLQRPQGRILFPEVNKTFAFQAPMCTPTLYEVMQSWQSVIDASDPALDALTPGSMLSDLPLEASPTGQNIGTAMQRMIYHYWYHIGETQAIRQMHGHQDPPQYVGDIEELAPYRTL